MASKPLRFHVQAEQEYLTALSWDVPTQTKTGLEWAPVPSLKKVRQQSCDFAYEHGAAVDSRSALYYFPGCFNDCSVGFRLC